jgi:hypothetical protein
MSVQERQDFDLYMPSACPAAWKVMAFILVLSQLLVFRNPG